MFSIQIWYGLNLVVALRHKKKLKVLSSIPFGVIGNFLFYNSPGNLTSCAGLYRNWFTFTSNLTENKCPRLWRYSDCVEKKGLLLHAISRINKILGRTETYDIREIWINRLKPTGHVMHQRFNIQQLYVLPTLNLCVLYLYKNKQRLVPLTA